MREEDFYSQLNSPKPDFLSLISQYPEHELHLRITQKYCNELNKKENSQFVDISYCVWLAIKKNQLKKAKKKLKKLKPIYSNVKYSCASYDELFELLEHEPDKLAKMAEETAIMGGLKPRMQKLLDRGEINDSR